MLIYLLRELKSSSIRLMAFIFIISSIDILELIFEELKFPSISKNDLLSLDGLWFSSSLSTIIFIGLSSYWFSFYIFLSFQILKNIDANFRFIVSTRTQYQIGNFVSGRNSKTMGYFMRNCSSFQTFWVF